MKKKLIENMPLPRIPKGTTGPVAIVRSPEKGLAVVDYIDADTNVLFLRIGLRKWEYMTYLPESAIWNQVNIRNIRSYLRIEPENPCNIEIIKGKSYLKKIFGMEDVGSIEDHINWTILRDREQARANRVDERNRNVNELSEKEEAWLYSYLKPIHYAYYRRKRKKVDIACTACGKNSSFYLNKYDLSLEEMVNSIDAPEHNMYGDCPICGARVQFKAAGRTKGVYERIDYRYILSRFGESDIVLRYFEVHKRFTGNEQYASESMRYVEVARTFFFENKVQRDYQKYNPYTGDCFWDDRNLAGMANIIKHSGKVYRGNLEQLKDTRFKYACIEKQLLNSDYSNMEEYMSAYQKYPFIEMLQKLGMTQMLGYITRNYYSTDLFDKEAKGGPAIFKITKERFNRMRDNNLNEDALMLFQLEKEKNIRFSEEEIEAYFKMNLNINQMEIITRYSSMTKVKNYIHKQIEQEKVQLFPCSALQNMYAERIRKYTDYLVMCEVNGRNLHDPHKMFPPDLDEAHNREVIYKSRWKLKAQQKEKNLKNPNIKKDAAGYNKIYMYQDDNYIIRAPKNAGEIYKEGLLLDHCVGRAGYIEAMNRHETVILLLRKKNKPNIPYYTVEVNGGKITQAYGKSDKKPDWDDVKSFLDAFTDAKLKKKKERKVG